MEISEEQLKAIEQYAAHGFTLVEIAVATDLDCKSFLIANGIDPARAATAARQVEQQTAISRQLWKGRLTALYQLRQSIFKQAIAGSTPAQAEMRKLLDHARNSIA